MTILILVMLIMYSSLFLIFWNLYLYIKSDKKKNVIVSLVLSFIFSFLVWSIYNTLNLYGCMGNEFKLPVILKNIPLLFNLLLTVSSLPLLLVLPFTKNKTFHKIFFFCAVFFLISIASFYISLFSPLTQYFLDNFYDCLPFLIQ